MSNQETAERLLLRQLPRLSSRWLVRNGDTERPDPRHHGPASRVDADEDLWCNRPIMLR